MIGNVIYNLLSNDTTLTGLVGEFEGTPKIYPFPAPRGVSLPYMVYRRLQTEPTREKDRATVLDQVTVQVEAYATGYTEGEQIMKATRDVLDRYDGIVDGQRVEIWMNNLSDEAYLDDLDVHAKAQEYDIWHFRN